MNKGAGLHNNIQTNSVKTNKLGTFGYRAVFPSRGAAKY